MLPFQLEPQRFYYFENGKPGKFGEIQLTDSIIEITKAGDKVFKYDFKGKYSIWFDTF